MPKLVHLFAGMLGVLACGVAAADLIDFETPVVALSETAIPGSSLPERSTVLIVTPSAL